MKKTERLSFHGLWASRLGFVLAATGSAVGLGNIWRFPYVVGENGGGIFVLLYMACVLLIGVPVMIAELMLGRRGRRNPIETMRVLAAEENLSRLWIWIGRIAMLAGFLILSYYSVIAGWILAYIVRSAGGAFHGMAEVAEFESIFSALIIDPERLITWHTLFMLLVIMIVARGVQRGLEKTVKFIMPLLLLILLLLLLYAATTTGFIASIKFMFMPDIGKLTGTGVLFAMGTAFFTLGLGMGAVMMYGAYLPRDVSIARVVLGVAMADTVIALLVGVVIFSIVFANGSTPSAGPGLIFITLPVAFAQIPIGGVVGVLFFILLLLAALASAIALLEPSVAWLIENKNMERIAATCLSGLAVWVMGLGTIFSFNLWADYKWTLPIDLGRVRYVIFEDKTFFDIVDFIASGILLPLGGLLLALFTAHAMRRQFCQQELSLGARHFNIWYFVLRNITPLALGVVLLHAVGLFRLVGIA